MDCEHEGDAEMYRKFSALLVPTFIVVMQPLQALAQAQPPTTPQTPQWYGPGPWMMWGDGYGWQYWWICPLVMIFMIAVLAVALLMMRSSGGGAHRWDAPWRSPSRSALQILSERFARGEIHRDEYEEKKAAILSAGHH
jgi:putative membrane protein